MHKLLIITAILFCSVITSAQNFRQFYFNPYLFNPAYSGATGYTEIDLIYRKQWLNFNNAPSASGFTLQHPTRKRTAFGLNFLTQEAVSLRYTSVLPSFTYRLPLSSGQTLSFGISAGGGINNLTLDEFDYTNDPTILNAAGNSWYADGNFGILYSVGELQLGFALPKLFGHPYFSRQRLGKNRFSQLKNQLYSIRYKFNVSPGAVSIEPYFLYRLNRDAQNSWEAAALLNLKDKISVGASYHNNQGIAFFLSMTIKEKFRFGYSYELPPSNDAFGFTNSHEFHLSIRLGKQKVDQAKRLTSSSSVSSTDYLTIDKKDTSETTPTTLPVPKAEPEITIDEKADAAWQTPKVPGQAVGSNLSSSDKLLTKGHYIVIGAFRNLENALRLQASTDMQMYMQEWIQKMVSIIPISTQRSIWITQKKPLKVTGLSRNLMTLGSSASNKNLETVY